MEVTELKIRPYHSDDEHLIMKAAEVELKKLGCLKVRSSNKSVIAFYQRLGFSDSNVIGMGKWL